MRAIAGGGNHVSEAERLAAGALPAAELAELRLAANRPLALPGGGSAPSLASSLSKLRGYAPALLGAHLPISHYISLYLGGYLPRLLGAPLAAPTPCPAPEPQPCPLPEPQP